MTNAEAFKHTMEGALFVFGVVAFVIVYACLHELGHWVVEMWRNWRDER